jgi:hypothetical protein
MERTYEKYAWVLLLALGLLWVAGGVIAIFLPEGYAESDVELVTNMSWSELEASSPVATDLIRFLYKTMGLIKTSWAFLVVVIIQTGYRKGEKWAWYTLWSLPILLGINALITTSLGSVSQTLEWILMMIVSLLGLLLPYRKFFPK